MKPASLPLAIVCTVVIFCGTVVIGVAIGLPQWSKITEPKNVDTGLFQVCEDGSSCENRAHETDEIRLVIALCIGGCVFGLVAFGVTIAFFVMFFKRMVHFCLEFLPWLTLSWSLITGSVIMAALVIFEDKEYDSNNPYNNLGISFVLCAIGGGVIALAGLMFFIVSHWLIKFAKREALTELERYEKQMDSIKDRASVKRF